MRSERVWNDNREEKNGEREREREREIIIVTIEPS